MARSQFAHLSRADEEYGAALKRSEDLARKVNRNGSDGNGARSDFSFGTNFLGGGKCALQQMFKLPGNGAGSARHGECFFYLAKNLRFADHHGVEAGGDAEEMTDCIAIVLLIDMRLEEGRIKAEVAVQEACQIGFGRLDGCQEFNAIAGGNDHALTDAWHCGQGTGRVRQIVARDGDFFAQLDGSGLVIDANEREGHWPPYLWT